MKQLTALTREQREQLTLLTDAHTTLTTECHQLRKDLPLQQQQGEQTEARCRTLGEALRVQQVGVFFLLMRQNGSAIVVLQLIFEYYFL